MRDQRFTFVLNHQERQALAELSQRLRRSQSDTVRLLVRDAAQAHGVAGAHGPTPESVGAAR